MNPHERLLEAAREAKHELYAVANLLHRREGYSSVESEMRRVETRLANAINESAAQPAPPGAAAPPTYDDRIEQTIEESARIAELIRLKKAYGKLFNENAALLGERDELLKRPASAPDLRAEVDAWRAMIDAYGGAWPERFSVNNAFDIRAANEAVERAAKEATGA